MPVRVSARTPEDSGQPTGLPGVAPLLCPRREDVEAPVFPAWTDRRSSSVPVSPPTRLTECCVRCASEKPKA
ncbi:hypothetical protein FQA47_010562 [Oryzias melastigma]|uniref:Uncharacterized protein n=1 Tax=Oryzias melastigma TaxID=30732 RepID=A0A834CD04_ORYME|nr:hypothetical protein FQA47_010562 [Oryzias melastigma]